MSSRRTWTKGLAFLAAVLVLATGMVVAFWGTPSAPGGGGSGVAATVNQGATPSAVVSGGSTITVSWAATTMSSGAAVTGYVVKRYDAGTLVQQGILSACTGVVTSTSCIESSVPQGAWRYSVTPVVGTAWTGAESSMSTAVTSDTTAPANDFSLNVTSGTAVLIGKKVFYAGTSAGSLKLVNAVSDSGTGPASSATAALGGTTTGWTHSASTVTTPAGGPYTSNAFSWNAGTTSSPTEVVTGKDAAGNATTTTLTFVNDAAGPAGGSVAATGLVGTGSAYAASTTLSLTLAKGTDSANGLATTGNQLLRATATLTSTGGADGVCGTFGSYTLVATDPGTPQTDTVTDQACYSYRYVVSDTLGYPTTYTSTPIKVDTTAPTAPVLTFGNGSATYWPGSGAVIYYRPAQASSFTATATSTDTASGVASYAWPALGTRWSSVAGTLGNITYNYTATPTAPGAKTVTATNNAAKTSGTTSFTATVDSTAPSAGSVTPPSTTQISPFVSVTFVTGTDAGSGIGSRLLQRESTSLTGTTCGTTYGGWTTVAANPTGSSFTDTDPRGFCYKYQYVVSDNVGNSTTATSANVAKIQQYSDVINATAGLLNQWRLGEATISSDSFIGTGGTLLSAHIGEIGATWTRNATLSGTGDMVISSTGQIHKSGTLTGSAVYYSSGAPASADYTVSASVTPLTLVTGDLAGVIGRVDPNVAAGTFYAAAYDRSAGVWALYSMVGGGYTSIGTPYAQTLTAGTTYRLSLDMNGSTIRLLVDGVVRVTATSTTITAPGRAGVIFGNGTATTITDTTGMQLDNFQATPQLADVKAVATGVYTNGPLLGQLGAMTDSSDTAATFDGINAYATVTEAMTNDFSVEFWLKSTQGIGTGTTWQSGAGLVDANITGNSLDWGISLRSDGKIIAGDGNGSGDFSLVSTNASPVNDGAWHQVVITRIKTTGLISIYIDGVAAGTMTGSTSTLTSPAITFARLSSGGNYYAGSLDEISIYNVALSSATVSTHYAAR